MDNYQILMRIVDKKFGKNYIHFEVKELSTDTILKEGKCSSMVDTRKEYKVLMDEYGEEKVLLLMK